MENQDKLQDQSGVLSPGNRVWVCGYGTEGIVKQEVRPDFFEVTTSNGAYTAWWGDLIKLCPVNNVIRRKLWYTQIGQGLQKLCVPKAGSNHILNVLRMREYITHLQCPISIPDPTQLAHPVRVITGLTYPCGIAFNSQREIIVSERRNHRIVVLDIKGDMIRTFGSCGDSPEKMILPTGIAVDDMDNIYVSSHHKLQKFTSSGELIKCVGMGSEPGGVTLNYPGGVTLNYPGGVTLYNNQVYVCDTCNNRIQVFDLDLNFIRSIGGEFDRPQDVKFDIDGYMYVADLELGNKRVQVLDRSGHFIRVFGEGKLSPVALHIIDNYVYVYTDNIAVYRTSGQFVTSFGEFSIHPGSYITSCADGFIYVCDYWNGLIQIF